MLRPLAIPFAALALLAAACSLDTSLGPTIPPESDSWSVNLGVNFQQMTKTASGLWIRDTQVGTGRTAAPGDSVQVFYNAYLRSGALFDSNVGRVPLAFRLSTTQFAVIPGFNEGIIGMKVGGKRRLIIPSELAYGQAGATDQFGRLIIPPNANLLFDVELVAAVPQTP